MLVRLVRPMRRKGSSKAFFVQWIPAHVKASAVGITLTVPVGDALIPVKITSQTAAVRLSLRTTDPSETKIRQAAVAVHLERLWQSLRNKPRSLTFKEAVALAGEVYRAFAEPLENDPGSPE